MQKIIKLLMPFLVSAAAFGAEVELTATAQGEFAQAREQALTTALHDAVRQGAGVEVISTSEVKNMTLVEDAVFSRSLGYIRSYKIISQHYDTVAQTYKLTIRADVSNRPIAENDTLAVALLLKRLKAPIIMVRAEEDITGVKSRRPISEPILADLARGMGMQILDAQAFKQRRDQDALRAGFESEKAAAQVRNIELNSYDLLITAEVNGEISDLFQPYPDIYARDASFDVILKAAWADTGETVAIMPIQNANFSGNNLAYQTLPHRMPRQMSSACLNRVLLGTEPRFANTNAKLFFRRILKKWITELDLGVNVVIRVLYADKNMLDQLVSSLQQQAGVGQVRFRNFDSKYYSVLEVESKLDYRALSDRILKIAPKLRLDSATPRRLTFENTSAKRQN